MKIRWWMVVGATILVAASLFVVRMLTVYWGVDASAVPLLHGVKPPEDGLLSPADSARPWIEPDLELSWVNPLSPNTGPVLKPSDAVIAFEVLGLQSSLQVPPPADWAAWLNDLDRATDGVRLALAGRTDSELLSVLLWMSDVTRGPEATKQEYQKLLENPSAEVDAGGRLVEGPLSSAVNELKLWALKKRLAPNWWDFGAEDVQKAIAAGTARYGLVWSREHFKRTETGQQTTWFHVLPSAPGRRVLSLLGHWLVIKVSASSAAQERLKLLRSVATSQLWLSEHGLLLANPDLPAVNQESKAVGLAEAGAAYRFAVPAADSDLSHIHSVLEAVRAALK